MAFAYSPKIVTDGLVLAVDAANKKSYPGSGTTWTDLAGSNNGTLENGATFDSGNGGSIVFDGSDDYVDFPHFDVGNSITIDAWFNINSGTSYHGIIGNWIGTGVNGDSWLLTQKPSSKIAFYIMYNQTQGTFIEDSNNISSNQWYNYTATFSDGDLKLYKSGELVSSNSISQTTLYENTNNIWVGKFNNYEFNGKIAHTKVYNKALTSTEVTQNYNALKSRFGL